MKLHFRAALRQPGMLLFLSFLILCSTSIVAQTLDFKFGPAFEQEETPQHINKVARQGHLLFYQKKSTTVTILDNYLTPGKTIPFAEWMGTAIDHYTSNGKSYLILKSANKEAKTQTVSSQEIGADLQAIGKPTIITTYKDVKVGGLVMTFPPVDNITIIKSPGENQILIYKQRNNKIEAVCFSPAKGVQWTRTFPLGDEKNPNEIIDLEITDSGDMYLLGTTVKRDESINPFLLIYSAESKKEKRSPITSEPDMDHWGYCLRFINDDTPVVAGLYKIKKTKQIGYRLLKIDTKAQTMQLFSTAAFSEAYTKVTYLGAYHPEYFRVVEILRLDNGSIVFSIEGRAVKSGKSMFTAYTSPTFIASVDAQGKEQWNTIIDKYQTQVQSTSLTGHCLLSKGNTVFMLFNDDLDNFERPLTHKADEGLIKKKIYVALAEIDASGTTKKIPFISRSKEEISSFTPLMIKKISRNVFHFTFQVGEKYKYATVEANGNLGASELFVNDGNIGYVGPNPSLN